jgi:hypothetical protein
MTEIILQAYKDVEQAMKTYNKVLEEQLNFLKSAPGSNPSIVERMTHGTHAMRDSSMIYLSYAKYVAYGMPESEDLVQEDLQG